MSDLTLVATEMVPGAATALLDGLADNGSIEALGYAADGFEATQMALKMRPDVLLVHATMPGMSGLQVAQIISQAAPEVACVLLAEKPDAELSRVAMVAGARALISPGMASREIYEVLAQVAAVKRVRQTVEYARATDPRQAPLCVAVAGGVGGAGRTTVAVNLGVLLALHAPKDCILVDAAPQASRACFLLNLRPTSGLPDLLEAGEDWPDYVLESCLAEHSSGLRLLASRSGAASDLLDQITLGFMASLVGHIRRRYRCAVFHMPAALWTAGAYLLRRCDRVLVVTTGSDLLCLHDTATYVSSLVEAGVPRAKVILVVNKVARGDPVSAGDLAEACQVSKVIQLPADPRPVADAMRTMNPAALNAPHSGFSRALAGLAETLLRQVQAADAA